MVKTENGYNSTDLGNITFNPRGEYSKDTTYEYLDTVSYRGGSYMCLVDLGDTITGIEPTEGKNTKYWQLVAIPGDITERYTKMYEDVVTKSGQVEVSRAAVSESQRQVEMAEADVKQMRQDTLNAAETAISSASSASESAQSAEASRTAAKESEDNVNALATTFDSHVNEKISKAEKEINNTKQNAVDAVSESLNAAVTKIENETNKQVKSVENAGASQVSAVNKAGKSRVDEISTAGSTVIDAVEIQQEKSVQSVIDEGTKQIKAVSDKATEQIGDVNTTGSTQVSTIETKGADQVKAIQEAGKNALQNISNGVDKGLSEEGKAADAKATGEAISKLTEDTTALQKRQNVLVGSKTGNPVSCDDAYSAPLCGLTVYGRSTQDGTPTPEAPVPIVSAGDGGSVAVNVTGANMLEGTKPGVKSTVYGITYTIDENGILITGTATKTFNISLHDDVKYRLTRGIYYITTRGLSSSTMLNFYFIGKFSSDIQNQKVTLTRDTEFSLSLQILGGTTLNTTVQVSLTRNEITTYSPYYEQLLTLPTPNGLPGIPVTSGGNYTDPQGQQWVCDEVNFESAMKVQRVTSVVFSDSSVFVEEQTSNGTRFKYTNKNLKKTDKTTADSSAFCSALALGKPGSTWSVPDVFTIASMTLFVKFANINSLGELQQYLQQTPMSLTAILDTPIETPLTPAELTAYKALTTYAPNTVVQATDGAGLKLNYQRDVNIVIKNLEYAIASMTTT